jgi:hypothetical protein
VSRKKNILSGGSQKISGSRQIIMWGPPENIWRQPHYFLAAAT